MQSLRVITINILLSGIAISIAFTAFLLDRILPFRLPSVLKLAAWPLLAFGASIILWAVFILAKHSGATGAPGDPTKTLVEKGPFAWVRNPIYGAGVLIILGLAFLTGSPFMLVYDLIYALGIDCYVRRVEEPSLERRFGDQFARYKDSVPRWFPRFRIGIC
ncbi:MAG: hypothetical protein GTO18_00385 [Anaerolineales bacterium]|nr:hypothetical protein [Anaerolineales bacterium]